MQQGNTLLPSDGWFEKVLPVLEIRINLKELAKENTETDV